MAVIGTEYIAIRPDTAGFEDETTSKVKGVALKAAGIFAATFAVQKVGAFLASAVTSASDLGESVSKVGVVFGKSQQKVLDFGKTSATALGMSKNEALGAAGTFGNLFTALGLTEDKSADMAVEITALATDLGSFNNVPVTDALDALRAGLAGEAEPLKRFGVNMNDATLKTKAMAMGLIENEKQALTPAAKAQAAYGLIMEQTSKAQGDFERTQDGLANRTKILQARFTDIKTEIGQGLLPAVSAVAGVLLANVGPAFEAVKDVAARLKPFFTDLIDLGRAIATLFVEVAKVAAPVVLALAAIAGVAIVSTLRAVMAVLIPFFEAIAGNRAAVTALVVLLGAWAAIQLAGVIRSAASAVVDLTKNVLGHITHQLAFNAAQTATLGVLGLAALAIGIVVSRLADQRKAAGEAAAALVEGAETTQEAIDRTKAALDKELAGRLDNLSEVRALAIQHEDLTKKLAEEEEAAADRRKKAIGRVSEAAGAGAAATVAAAGISTEAIEAEAKAAEDLANAISSSYRSSTSVVSAFAAETDVTKAKILAFFADQVKAAQDWSTNLVELSKSAIDRGLLAEVAAAGPKAAPLVAALLDAVRSGNAGVINKAQEDLRRIMGDTIATVGAAAGPAGAAGAGVGASITAGMARGIASQAENVYNETTRIVNGAITKSRSLLRAVSPSKVTADLIGKPFSQGIAVGIRGAAGDIEDAVADVVRSVTSAELPTLNVAVNASTSALDVAAPAVPTTTGALGGGAFAVTAPITISATFNGPTDASSVTDALRDVARTEVTEALSRVVRSAASGTGRA